MPAAIPLIVAVAASYAAEYFAVALIVSQLVGALISFVAVSLLTKKPKAPDLAGFLNAAGAGRTQQVRQPVSPHTIGYGRYKTSGPILFIHTATDDEGRANGYLYLIHALVSTKIKAIRDIYFNDDFASAAKYSGFARINKHLGATDQTADSDFVSEIPDNWTSNHRGRGIAYIATRLKWSATAYPSGIPNIAAIVDGVEEIYDPRTEATGFTNNAALCIADWLTKPYGRNLAWARLDEDSVIAAANICDERVLVRQYSIAFTASASTDVLTLADGARSLDWGDGVRVDSAAGSPPPGTLPTGLSAGTTYYVIPILNNQIKLATTVANAMAGTAIDIGDSTGSVELTYYDEARYKLNGSFTLDTENGEVLDQLRDAMAGYVFPRSGKWFMYAGAAVTPTFELNEDHLAGGISIEPKRSMRDRINGVRAVFVNPDANWQPDDSPVLVPTAGLLEEDDGEELYGDLRLLFVTSRQQMGRLMKIFRDRNRQQATVQAVWQFHALGIAPLDTGTLTLSRYYPEGATFECMGWQLDESGIKLPLVAYSSTVYDWTTEDEADITPRQSVVLPSGALEPPDITVDSPETEVFSELDVSWPIVLVAGVVGYDVEYSDAGAETWSASDRVTGTTYTVTTAIPTDIRVRTATASEVSAWAYAYAPGIPSGVIHTGPGGRIVTWSSGALATDIQVFEAGTLIATTESDGSYDTLTGSPPFNIRSVSAEGNISDLVESLEE